ncbi:pentapeptide repeat-containing protein [Riemerella anatipestifer]|uniref:pentapeptide repeat-containing protein n=4 Tax=Riemerella anatipestifer TaxID=34085 RepID=UPI0012AE9355|nr:pentapeptide repeat-containing protein [Riemerella anatipestifer]MCO7319081.1 pentapeptide repeat-containing protein [Riemerella anatipestifer]MCW0474561.1 pentapeptide repeat-containing protein [Riemerella anatipestifer]MDR7775409.1 pentapeptide repeat-containing protein [Riemerella anatipestifer]MDR7784029.1 pentapeptide repeat-containing protein [Riemerella anatipestifer]MDY3347152.1 pentapeptide repeat-containing protein [Riemerella anatipestifer]
MGNISTKEITDNSEIAKHKNNIANQLGIEYDEIDKFIGIRKFVEITINKNSNDEINDIVDFSDSIIVGYINFENITFKQTFTAKKCIFIGEVNLKEAKFEGKTRFHNSIFLENVDFENTTFEDLVDFYYAEFRKPQQFYLTDFLGITIFSNATFHEQVQFLYCRIDDKTLISFERAEFKKSLDISRANFWCKLNVWGISFLDEYIIPEGKDQWGLYETDDIKKSNNKHSNECLKKIRESYRRIKQEYKNEANIIEAGKLYAYEMKAYEEEVKLKYKKESEKDEHEDKNKLILGFNKKEIGKFIVHPKIIYTTIYIVELFLFIPRAIFVLSKEEVILKSSEYSNDYGRSWKRGVAFTMFFGFIFYAILFFISNYDRIKGWVCQLCQLFMKEDYLKIFCDKSINFITGYLRFLNLTDWKYEFFNIKDLGLGYAILFIGRIFIGYGYYQTIQAFRKYGKN